MKSSLLSSIDSVIQAYKPLDMFVSRVTRLILPQATAKACGTPWGSCASEWRETCGETCYQGRIWGKRVLRTTYLNQYGDCSVTCDSCLRYVQFPHTC